mmetsp:Transcript_26212/g.71228  ORF Transcript_26212/g.71228 Transcript_26212/m.71228 type:complete len:230 (+) Transcript_26212:1331-2020(+)
MGLSRAEELVPALRELVLLLPRELQAANDPGPRVCREDVWPIVWRWENVPAVGQYLEVVLLLDLKRISEDCLGPRDTVIEFLRHLACEIERLRHLVGPSGLILPIPDVRADQRYVRLRETSCPAYVLEGVRWRAALRLEPDTDLEGFLLRQQLVKLGTVAQYVGEVDVWPEALDVLLCLFPELSNRHTVDLLLLLLFGAQHHQCHISLLHGVLRGVVCQAFFDVASGNH